MDSRLGLRAAKHRTTAWRTPRRAARTLKLLLLALFALSSLAATVYAASIGSTRLDQLPQAWVDEHGSKVRLTEFAGQRVILTMAFANCHQLCPAAIAELQLMQQALDARKDSAQIVVIGLDPQNEDPAMWREYRKTHRISQANWHFLTGSTPDTETTARQLGFDFWKLDDHVMHESRAIIFDASGVLARELGPETRSWRRAL
jgi:protein SCO1